MTERREKAGDKGAVAPARVVLSNLSRKILWLRAFSWQKSCANLRPGVLRNVARALLNSARAELCRTLELTQAKRSDV